MLKLKAIMKVASLALSLVICMAVPQNKVAADYGLSNHHLIPAVFTKQPTLTCLTRPKTCTILSGKDVKAGKKVVAILTDRDGQPQIFDFTPKSVKVTDGGSNQTRIGIQGSNLNNLEHIVLSMNHEAYIEYAKTARPAAAGAGFFI